MLFIVNDKKRLIVSVILSIIMTLILSHTVLEQCFLVIPQESIIRIEDTALRNRASGGTDVRLAGVRIDNEAVPFEELKQNGDWTYLDDLLIAINPPKPISLEYSAKNAKLLEIDLQKHDGSGIVSIYINNREVKRIDLYSSSWEEFTYTEELAKVSIFSHGYLFVLVFLCLFIFVLIFPRIAKKIKDDTTYRDYIIYIAVPYTILISGMVFYGGLIERVENLIVVLSISAITLIVTGMLKDRQSKWIAICVNFGLIMFTSFLLFFVVEDINDNFRMSRINYMFGNVSIYFTIISLLWVVARRIDFAISAGAIISFIYGTTNYYVAKFRGSPIVPGDFFTIGTAKNVIKNYSYDITWSLFFSVMLLLIWCMTVRFMMRKISSNRTRLSVLGIIPFVVGIMCITKMDFYKPTLDFWNLNNNVKKYGVALSLVSNIRNMKISEPEGYTYEEVQELCDSYDTFDEADGFTPNVIAIMNESFSDLSVLSEMIDNSTYMSFYNSLKENTIKGLALASTIGGGTGNTEYEFLTGNSMAFIPGTVPYQQFVLSDAFSLASIFKDRGYSTTAIHPYYKSGYNRQKVYPYFGFDTFLDITVFNQPELSRNRYITDVESYKKVIEVFEETQKNGQPAFIFNVTIQNHSDYSTGFYGDDRVTIPGVEGVFPDAEEYLTLMKESDDAIGFLLDYFASTESPTVVVFFGDHLPKVSNEFYERMMGKPMGALSLEETQRRYSVPFFIWANYDIAERENVFTSVNYLGEMLFQEAGMNLTPYQRFQSDLQERIPAININGYLGDDSVWYGYLQGSQYTDILADYWNIQYNNMFDRKKQRKWYSTE